MTPSTTWRGVHLILHRESQAQDLLKALKPLADIGVNVVIVEVDYCMAFTKEENRLYTFREEGKPPVSKKTAGDLVDEAREVGIRLIPQFDCLGHQGFHDPPLPLLHNNPSFEEPRMPGGDEYNLPRSWCALHPDVMPVVLRLIDEIIDVFNADAFHVGMDEVMRIASPACPRCAHHDPGELLAGVVKQLHAHITGEKGLPMLMWGDRLVPQSAIPGANRNEASDNGTHTAIDLISKDIVICDWRYRSFDEYQRAYPSVGYFLSHGFKIWPSGGWKCKNVKSFHEHALALRKETTDVVGFLCTTWDKIAIADAASSPSIRDVLPTWKNA